MKNYLDWWWKKLKDWWNKVPKEYPSPNIYQRYQQLNSEWFINNTPSTWVPAGCYILDKLYENLGVVKGLNEELKNLGKTVKIEDWDVTIQKEMQNTEIKYYNSKGVLCAVSSKEEIKL